MSALQAALSEYLATRRALGTKLKWPESSLRKFVDFVEAEGAEFVNTDLATRWALQPVGGCCVARPLAEAVAVEMAEVLSGGV